MRKFWFSYLAKAMVVLPGGFGTFDEFMEVVTLVQTLKLKKHCRSSCSAPSTGRDPELRTDGEVRPISPDDLGYLQPASTPEEAFTILRDFLIANHLVPATTQEQKTPGIAKTQS